MNIRQKAENNDNQPTDILLTFENTDKFGRREFAERLTKALETFYPFYNEAYVLGLNGSYGTGKTTFLKMWQSLLQSEKYNHKVIYINAWETDFDEEPLIPIISNILDAISDDKTTESIKVALKAALVAGVLTTNDFLAYQTGIDIQKIVSGTHDQTSKKEIQVMGQEIYKEFSFKETAYKALKQQLANYVIQLNGKPLIIFIDELDRVRPDYAVKFLEAIKHIFSVQGVCFVLAVDREQLEQSVRQLYGNVNFENYYLRFISSEIDLPIDGDINWSLFVRETAKIYLSDEFPKKVPIDPNYTETLLNSLVMYTKIFSLTARQCEKLIRHFFQIISVEPTISNCFRPSYLEATIFLVTLKIVDKYVYHKIGAGNISPQELKQYLKGLNYNHSSTNNYERHVLHTTMSYILNTVNQKEIGEIIATHNGHKSTQPNFENAVTDATNHLLQIQGNFASLYSQSTFSDIYKKIEAWEDFLKNTF